MFGIRINGGFAELVVSVLYSSLGNSGLDLRRLYFYSNCFIRDVSQKKVMLITNGPYPIPIVDLGGSSFFNTGVIIFLLLLLLIRRLRLYTALKKLLAFKKNTAKLSHLHNQKMKDRSILKEDPNKINIIL